MDEWIVETAFRYGISAASAILGHGENKIRGAVRGWVGARDADQTRTLPDNLGLHHLEIGGVCRIVATDLQYMRIVEVVPSADQLLQWLSERNSDPSITFVPIDPRIADAVRSVFPASELAVARHESRAAVESAGQSTLRSIVRDGIAKGRNFRENPCLLGKADDSLDDAEVEDMGMWSRTARVLRRCMLDLLARIDASDGDGFDRVVATSRTRLAELVPSCPLVRLLETWGKAMARGLRESWVDEACEAVVSIIATVRRLRPRIGLDILRGVLVLADDPGPSSSGRLVSRGFAEVELAIDTYWGDATEATG